jgi:translation initiation factor 2 subunit 2
MDYEKMLEEGLKKLPEVTVKTERFEIPKVSGHIQGNKTVINNFNIIVSALRRDSSHFLKYLLREIAAPGNLDGSRLIISRKVSSSLLNMKIKEYAEKYVICPTCGKQDTVLTEKEGVIYLKCTACGNQKEVKL